MVDVSNLKSDAGLTQLNDFLATRSYVEGYQPTTADVDVHKAVGKIPDAKKFANVVRYYNHISSFSNEERAKFAKGQAPSSGDSKGKATTEKKEDEVDLFGEEDDTAAEAAHELALKKKAEAAGKAGKKAVIAKSSLVLDVKPWDDETDLVEMERLVRSVQIEGLTWGASKLVEIAYGLKKLQIMATIVDDLVSVDDVQDQIQAFEDNIQSTDIAAFNKI
jgi:elongation factor 1-beta